MRDFVERRTTGTVSFDQTKHRLGFSAVRAHVNGNLMLRPLKLKETLVKNSLVAEKDRRRKK